MDINEAASHGNIDDIKSAAEQGCDINDCDKDGKTPLWFAAQRGQTEACRFLIAQGAGIEAPNPSSILEVAVQGGHGDIVELLWPHCDAVREYRSLENAISLGFHEIADFLIQTGRFQYSDTESLVTVEFPHRVSTAFQQWERFLFVRRGQELPLHHVFLDYALLLATKSDRNAGLRLVEFLLGESMADANCKIKVNDDFETPLTAAAENGNLEILAVLIDHPNTNITICGKYDWPAFLHLLASPLSISTESGRVIARRLSCETSSHRFFLGSGHRLHLRRAFDNVLRFGDGGLVKQVIDLVHGQAGILILPLLIRANEADGVAWVLDSDALSATLAIPPPGFWVLLCQYFEHHDDQNALELFTSVAEFLAEKKIWNELIPKCLYIRNFSFIQQFFYPHEAPPGEVTEATLIGLLAMPEDQPLIKEWASTGFANATLWNAIYCGLWTSPAFERILFNSSIDLNGQDPNRSSRGRQEPLDIPHAFFSDLSSEGERPRIPLGTLPTGPMPRQVADYHLQLMLLEQQNKRRVIIARDTRSPLSWAITNRNVPLFDALLWSPRVNVNLKDGKGRSPLMYAIAGNNRPMVERLLNHRDIDLNLRDDEGRTAMFYAVQGNDLEMVQLLVGTQKVDYSIRNNSSQTAQEFAKKTRKKKDIIAAFGK